MAECDFFFFCQLLQLDLKDARVSKEQCYFQHAVHGAAGSQVQPSECWDFCYCLQMCSFSDSETLVDPEGFLMMLVEFT